MNRIFLGVLLGIGFGVIDALMVVFGKNPDRTTTMLLQAFFSRFAIGLLGANVSFGIHTVASGAIVGLLISLPDAFALKSYPGILGTGLLFGTLAGWAANAWAK
jgi:predicted outer membrane lipoprotein